MTGGIDPSFFLFQNPFLIRLDRIACDQDFFFLRLKAIITLVFSSRLSRCFSYFS